MLFYQVQLLSVSKVLDTIEIPDERRSDKIVEISIAPLLADAIIRIHEKRPLSPLFELHIPTEN